MTHSIFDIHEKTKISMRKLKQMNHWGMLNIDGEKPIEKTAPMRYYLKRGRKLTAEHCCQLIRNPELIAELGEFKSTVKSQVSALGDVQSGALTQWGLIDPAARNDPQSVTALAKWIATVIPSSGCGYHYIAARMLFAVPAHMLKTIYPILPQAIIKARQSPVLAGMTDNAGKAGEKIRFFQLEKTFDL